MQPKLAASSYPPSSVHTTAEIGERGAPTAAELVMLLGLEKSSVHGAQAGRVGLPTRMPFESAFTNNEARRSLSSKRLPGARWARRLATCPANSNRLRQPGRSARRSPANPTYWRPASRGTHFVHGYQPSGVSQMRAEYRAQHANFGQPLESLRRRHGRVDGARAKPAQTKFGQC